MPYGMTLWRTALVTFNGSAVTDHNRGEVGESVERIGGSTRTARGTLRRYHVADKHSFNISWDMLPGPDNKTVDGFWGADSIISFYNTTTGSFTLGMTTDVWDETEYTVRTYTVVFSDFDYSIEKRWSRYFYSISLALEEV
jgi:hypothetical protein